jgi:hypothetical protein
MMRLAQCSVMIFHLGRKVRRGPFWARLVPLGHQEADRVRCHGLRQLVAEDNDAMLREYRERLAERTGVMVCIAVICEALKRLKLRPKRPSGRPSKIGLKLPPSVRFTASR